MLFWRAGAATQPLEPCAPAASAPAARRCWAAQPCWFAAGLAGRAALAHQPGGGAGAGSCRPPPLRCRCWLDAQPRRARSSGRRAFRSCCSRTWRLSHPGAAAPAGRSRGAGDDHSAGEGCWRPAKIVGVISAIVLGGRLLLRPCCAGSPRANPEIFTAALLLVGTVTICQGLSMALGAFLALRVAGPRDSEYRRELETDIGAPSRAFCECGSSSPWV